MAAVRKHVARHVSAAVRDDVLSAIRETAPAWQRAYLGEPPTPGEMAAVWLLGALDAPADLDDPIGVMVGERLG